MRILWLSIWSCASLLTACASAGSPASGPDLAAGAPVCEERPVQVASLLGSSTDHEDPNTWGRSLPGDAAKKILMSTQEIAALNLRNRQDAWGHQDVLASEVVEPNRVAKELRERFDWLAERLSTRKYIEGAPGTLAAAQRLADRSRHVLEARVVTASTDLRCVPSVDGFYTEPVDRDFDRNQCSRLHMGEVVRVLRVSEDASWRYVHAGHSVGWVQGEVLTPALLLEDAQAFRSPSRQVVVVADHEEQKLGLKLQIGTTLPLIDDEGHEGELTVVVPTVSGLRAHQLDLDSEALHVGPLSFARADVWRLALSTLGDPYGWGERDGNRDCSRLVLDVFRAFGIELGRHSLAQARSGSRTVDLKGLDERAKREAIREAARDNVVLLYMPGHIMLYLGESGGEPFAVSAISEFVAPCQGAGDQVCRLDKITVSGLEIGRHTERTSYIERLSHLAVFGR